MGGTYGHVVAELFAHEYEEGEDCAEECKRPGPVDALEDSFLVLRLALFIYKFLSGSPTRLCIGSTTHLSNVVQIKLGQEERNHKDGHLTQESPSPPKPIRNEPANGTSESQPKRIEHARKPLRQTAIARAEHIRRDNTRRRIDPSATHTTQL